jgi:RNA polymerase sigma-70 factor (ECF subfamily)
MEAEGLDSLACVERVRQGDEEAARALMHHLHPLVLKLVRAHRPRRTDEEDLVQTVFMKVFAKLDQFSGTVPLEHWVARVTVNTCVNQLRHEQVRPELRLADLNEEEEHVVHSLATTPEDLPTSQASAARELVAKLLTHLDPEDRLVVTLLHLEERSVEEVRRATGWGAARVKVRAFRARQKMKKHLTNLLRESVA